MKATRLLSGRPDCDLFLSTNAEEQLSLAATDRFPTSQLEHKAAIGVGGLFEVRGIGWKMLFAERVASTRNKPSGMKGSKQSATILTTQAVSFTAGERSG